MDLARKSAEKSTSPGNSPYRTQVDLVTMEIGGLVLMRVDIDRIWLARREPILRSIYVECIHGVYVYGWPFRVGPPVGNETALEAQ